MPSYSTNLGLRVASVVFLLVGVAVPFRVAHGEEKLNGFMETMLGKVKKACEAFATPTSTAPEAVQEAKEAQEDCLIDEVASLLKRQAVIMDCLFSSNVTERCMAVVPGKQTPWKHCPSIWAAYMGGSISKTNAKPCAA